MASHNILAKRIEWATDKAAQEKLVKLWNQTDPQLSTAQIGAAFDMSKSAIGGAVKRLAAAGLHLPERACPIGIAGANPPRVRRPEGTGAVPPPPLATVDASAPVVEEPPRRRLYADDGGGKPGCCWPVGAPGDPGFHFCGESLAAPGRPYCPEHAAIAVIDIRQLERERVALPEVEAYAAEHRIVPKKASGLAGLMVAVNNHRRQRGQMAFSVARNT